MKIELLKKFLNKEDLILVLSNDYQYRGKIEDLHEDIVEFRCSNGKFIMISCEKIVEVIEK